MSFDRPQSSTRPYVAVACILPTLALGLRGFSDWAWLGAPAAGFWGAAAAWAATLTFFATCVALDLRGGTRAARTGLVLFAGFALLHGLGAAAFINGRFDTPGEEQGARVVGVRETKGKHPEFYLNVQPGLRGEDESELRVARDLFRRTAQGDTVRVIVHQGRLGGAWYRVAPVASPPSVTGSP